MTIKELIDKYFKLGGVEYTCRGHGEKLAPVTDGVLKKM